MMNRTSRAGRSSRRIVLQLLSPFQEFLRVESSGGILLIAFTLLALLWANSPWSDAYLALWETKLTITFGEFGLSKAALKWINDGLMAIFFFVVGLEIKREVLVGELSSIRQAAFPIFAALGGMLAPAIIYFLINSEGPAVRGWGIPMATDIAFALGVLALLGRRVPTSLKVFLTAVAIVDDIGAVLVIALFYTSEIAWWSLAAAGGFFLILVAFNQMRVRDPLPYALIGFALWFATLQSGVHATIAGVLVALTIPASRRINSRQFIDKVRSYIDSFESASEPETLIRTNSEQRSALQAIEDAVNGVEAPLQRLEHAFHPWVAYAIMPIFAFANAGVELGGDLQAAITDPEALGIILGLVVGKQLGITGAAWLAVSLGIADRPAELSWKLIHGAACLAGIGFTMSLFVANLAFDAPDVLATAKIGILVGSLVSGLIGWGVIRSSLK